MTKEVMMYDSKLRINLPEEFLASNSADKYFQSAKPDYLFVYEGKNALVSVTINNEKSNEEDIELVKKTINV